LPKNETQIKQTSEDFAINSQLMTINGRKNKNVVSCTKYFYGWFAVGFPD